MVHVLKRYNNRKLYDPEAGRYVGLSDIVEWIRQDETVQVLSNETGEDLTVQVLGRVIVEEHRAGRGTVSIPNLHELIRASGHLLSAGAGRARSDVAKAFKAAREKMDSIVHLRDEASDLHKRLAELEARLASIEGVADGPAKKKPRRKASRKKTSRKKASRKKASKKKATRKKATRKKTRRA